MKITGKRGLKVLLSLTVDLFKSNEISEYSVYSLNENEKIINNQYNYFIPVLISTFCENGQFFDKITYFFQNKRILKSL